MNVFAYYYEGAPLSLWVRSWKSRGWKPKILMRGAKRVRPTVAARIINYSFRRTRSSHHNITRAIRCWNDKGWETAPIVAYPVEFTEADILAARPL